MAKPIIYTPKDRDPRKELLSKLEHAHQDHVEALLDVYEILQLMKDKGLLEIAKGALGSGENILHVVTASMETEEVTTLVRNLIILTKLLGGLNPEILEGVEKAFASSILEAQTGRPPGLFGLLGRMTSTGSRRFLSALVSVMETVGKNWQNAEEPALRGEKRKKVTRRQVALVPNEPRAP